MTPADSLYPSSIGLTCTVHREGRQILVTARWGRYAREKSESATTPQGNPTTVWKRCPMGNLGKVVPLAVVFGVRQNRTHGLSCTWWLMPGTPRQ